MKRFVAFFLCLLILPATLADGAPTLAGEVLSGMMERAGAADVQAWLDHADEGDEWTVIALRQSGTEYDISAYRQRLEEYLAGTVVRSASTRLKYAFALLAVGGDGELIARLAEVDTLGLFSFVPFEQLLVPMVCTFAGAGFFVGIVGSWTSIRKFMNV